MIHGRRQRVLKAPRQEQILIRGGESRLPEAEGGWVRPPSPGLLMEAWTGPIGDEGLRRRRPILQVSYQYSHVVASW